MPMPDPLPSEPPFSGEPVCFNCHKTPDQLPEYSREMIDYPQSWTTADYVRFEEGTYNPNVNRFCCTSCYIEIGMPTAPQGWKAP